MNNHTTKTSSEHVKLSPVFMLLAGAAISMSVASMTVGMDLLLYGYARSVSQASLMILWWAALALPAGLIAGAMALGMTKLSRGLLSPTMAIAGLLGIALHFGSALLFTDRNLFVTVPIPWIMAFGAYRLMERRGAGTAWHARGLVVVAITAVWVPIVVVAGVQVHRLSSLLGWGLVMLAIPALVQWLAGKRPKTSLAIVAVMLAMVQWQGQSLTAWQRNEKSESASDTGGQATTGSQATAGGQTAAGSQAATPARPNVVLIVLDTTRADRLGCYGSDSGLTPNIDKLAEQGVRYTNAIATSSWTVPTHASLFTGYYLKTHGCGSDPHRWLDDGFVTLAETLGEAGYQTVALSSNQYVEAANLLQGFDADLRVDFDRNRLSSRFLAWIQRIGLPASWADHGAAACVQGIKEWFTTDHNAEAPLFLFVNLMEAHWPYLPPAKWRASQLADDVGFMEATRTSHMYYGVNWFAGEPHSKRAEQIIRNLYAAGIAYEDYQVGHILKLLDQHVDMDNTIVIITADHGENLGEGGRWDHVFALNDKLIQVPLIVRYPPAFPAGLKLEGQVQSVDVAPTVLDLVGLPRPEDDWPGRVITPAKYQPYEHTFAEVFPYYGHLARLVNVMGLQRDVATFSGHLRMVRTDQYKYVWSSRGDHALFDLSKDSAEARNIIAAYPDIAASLRQELDRWYDKTVAYVPRTKGLSPVDKDALESLRSLGYVGD